MIGLSLREVSRRLGYSVSSLHEHQKRGRFKPLKDGEQGQAPNEKCAAGA